VGFSTGLMHSYLQHLSHIFLKCISF